MLVRGYSLKMGLPDCNPFATSANAVAELSDDASEVLPYLHAILPKVRYNPRGPVLTISLDGRRVVLQARQAAVTRVEDEADARRVLDWLLETINRTWDERERITPNHQATRELKLLKVYRLLPGGNCGACGEATCMAFAVRIVKGGADVTACAPLEAPGQEARLERFLSLVGRPE